MKIILALFVSLLSASHVHAAIVTAVERSPGGSAPQLRSGNTFSNDGYAAQVWHDYTFLYGSVPAYLSHADQILTTYYADKLDPNFQMRLKLATPATVYLLIDDRVPNVATQMPWVSTGGFVDTGDNATVREVTTMSIYRAQVPAGDLLLYQQHDININSGMYTVAVTPEPAGVFLLCGGTIALLHRVRGRFASSRVA